MQRFREIDRVPFCTLLTDTHTHQLEHPRARRAVEDRHLAAVELDQSVVHTHTVEGRHQVLHRSNRLTTAADGGTTRGLAHPVGKRRLGYDIDTVDTSESDTKIFGCGLHRHSNRAACMQAGSCEAELLIDSLLIFHWRSFQYCRHKPKVVHTVELGTVVFQSGAAAHQV